jgi:hypothetical protein
MHAGAAIALGFAGSTIISRALASLTTEMARAFGASMGGSRCFF